MSECYHNFEFQDVWMGGQYVGMAYFTCSKCGVVYSGEFHLEESDEQ